MPTEELLTSQPVELTVSMDAIISRHGHRVVCERCGEDIINERETHKDGMIFCQACVGNAYYETLSTHAPLATTFQFLSIQS